MTHAFLHEIVAGAVFYYHTVIGDTQAYLMVQIMSAKSPDGRKVFVKPLAAAPNTYVWVDRQHLFRVVQ